MRFKLFLGSCLILFMIGLTACSSGASLDVKAKEQMVEHIEQLETSEYDLIYFKKTYEEYLAAVDGIVSDAYLESASERIIFGYDDVKYTGKDLIGIPAEEYNQHKQHMLGLIRATGLDKLKVTVGISDVFEGEQEKQVYVYTSETKEVKDKPFTMTTKRYTIERQEGQWLITGVEQDKFTYGSEQTAEEIEKHIKALKYQTHGDQPVKYTSTLVLSGVGED